MTTINALPSAPSRASSPATFATDADAFAGALPTLVTQINAVAGEVNTNTATASAAAATATTQAGIATTQAATATTQAGIANTQATTATTQAGIATTQANAAAASAASAAAIAGAFVGTSISSLTIALGSKSFATQAGEQYTAGIWLSAVSAASGSNWMFGQVTSYTGSTLVLDVQAVGGAGTFADWNLSLTGARGAQGTAGVPIGYTALADCGTSTAAPGVGDGEFVILDGMGLYRYDISSTELVDGEIVVGSSTGTGRWIQMLPHWDFQWAALAPLLDNLQAQTNDLVATVTLASASAMGLGDYLSTVVVSSTAPVAAVNIDFPPEYDSFVILVDAYLPDTAGQQASMRFSLDGALDTTVDHEHYSFVGASNSAPAALSGNNGSFFPLMSNMTFGTGTDGTIRVEISNATQKTRIKSAKWWVQWSYSNQTNVGGGYQSQSYAKALTGVQFYQGGGNISGVFRLYGIKRTTV